MVHSKAHADACFPLELKLKGEARPVSMVVNAGEDSLSTG